MPQINTFVYEKMAHDYLTALKSLAHTPEVENTILKPAADNYLGMLIRDTDKNTISVPQKNIIQTLAAPVILDIEGHALKSPVKPAQSSKLAAYFATMPEHGKQLNRWEQQRQDATGVFTKNNQPLNILLSRLIEISQGYGPKTDPYLQKNAREVLNSLNEDPNALNNLRERTKGFPGIDSPTSLVLKKSPEAQALNPSIGSDDSVLITKKAENVFPDNQYARFLDDNTIQLAGPFEHTQKTATDKPVREITVTRPPRNQPETIEPETSQPASTSAADKRSPKTREKRPPREKVMALEKPAGEIPSNLAEKLGMTEKNVKPHVSEVTTSKASVKPEPYRIEPFEDNDLINAIAGNRDFKFRNKIRQDIFDYNKQKAVAAVNHSFSDLGSDEERQANVYTNFSVIADLLKWGEDGQLIGLDMKAIAKSNLSQERARELVATTALLKAFPESNYPDLPKFIKKPTDEKILQKIEEGRQIREKYGLLSRQYQKLYPELLTMVRDFLRQPSS